MPNIKIMAKKKASLGCLFWVALILLVFVIILFNLKQVNTVLKQTGLNTFLDDLVKIEDPAGTPEVTMTPIVISETDSPGSPAPEALGTPGLVSEKPGPEETPPGEISVNLLTDTPATPSPPAEPDLNLRRANLYYARLKGENLTFHSIQRKIYYRSAPLKATLEQLLAGLTSREESQGYMNLIPPGTEIKKVYVRNNIAFIDFNESFQFNPMGTRGLDAQLYQVVFTATEYKNLIGVQILIEGEKINYLGAEGLYTGRPLTREHF